MATLSSVSYFLPIFAFLLVFILVYAILKKTQVLGENNAVAIFISFILASFFVVEASLVEFVQFSSAWFGVVVVGVFFLFVILAFIPGNEGLDFLKQGNWFSWVLLGIMVAMLIISSAYVFNWAVNWDTLGVWIHSDWFGMILILVVAAIVSLIITKAK